MSEQQNQPPKPTPALTEQQVQDIKKQPEYGKTVKVVQTEQGARKLGLMKG